MNKFLIAAAATLATLFAVPANAKEGSWQIGNNQFHIYYTDLDMTSTAGRAAMLARVEKAAGKLCGNLVTVDREACVVDTVRQATKVPGGAMLKLALNERDGVAYAAR